MEADAVTREIINYVFICMPLASLDDRYMELINRNRFNLELGMDFRALDKFSLRDFRKFAGKFSDLGIKLTIHAPFHEIFLGAPDRIIREASAKRMDMAFRAAELFSPVSVVMHLNYEEKRLGFVYGEWHRNIIPALKRYSEKCGEMGAFLSVENVWEENPRVMKEVFGDLKGYPVFHCFDVGHCNCFSEAGQGEWIAELGPWIRQFHLHDNNGRADMHSPIGTGTIDFKQIKNFIMKMKTGPVITLEPHTERDLWDTLDGFSKTGLIDAIRE